MRVQSPIITMDHGDVVVTELVYSWPDGESVFERRFCAIGRYVYQVHDGRAITQVCEGLLPTGPTLMLCGSLEDTIRAQLD